jgi:hypothetical protein
MIFMTPKVIPLTIYYPNGENSQVSMVISPILLQIEGNLIQ